MSRPARRSASAWGGYETLPSSSNVSPRAEGILLDGMRRLLGADGKGPSRLGAEAAKAETEFARQEDAKKVDLPQLSMRPMGERSLPVA
jgi:hypothetical protein